ncbi:helix-turn-helix transcriptional regulator [Brevibacillus humidisoli]|uniref:helix-turn-helix domain-containing protein n=1 Tax=Brevibacillus humidisoli TaxID=2895522 RepID=UPI001E50BE62|nr:helix-turn-helix transcriptional regulator [Brevibacillus humidisoli]UFJ41486.1 helix-turn-helix transcriptional regulator [Brevibacillus humidisoli]
MDMQPTIRSEIEKQLREKGYTLSKLGELTGINSGNLSEILNGNPPRAITIRQLDAIAAAFGYQPGWLYELYPEECATHERVSRPRVIPYLVRCAELGRKDLIEQVVAVLMENPKNVSILFAVGEQLYEAGKRKESTLFYRLVIDNEKDNHSDRYLISQYRLFRASLGTDVEENWKAVIRFEPYRNRLPEGYRLDGLLQLANTCYALKKWEYVFKFANELQKLSTLVYRNELRKRKSKRAREALNTERHLVVYYGQGYLMKGLALENLGRYEEARQCVEEYADLSWFEPLDEIGKKEVEKFRLRAVANRYTLDMLMGKTDILPDYIDFLSENPKEILPGLITIIKSANQYNFTVDHILRQFSEHIKHFEEQQDAIKISERLQFRYQLAVYLIKKGNILEGLDHTVMCINLSDATRDYDSFKRCVALFWVYRQHATDQQKVTFQDVTIRGVIDIEKDFALSDSVTRDS